MLLGQQFGRRHNSDLAAAFHGLDRCRRSHHCFARAHIALHQSHHGVALRQVVEQLCHHALLRAGQRKRQRVIKLRQHAAVSL